LKAYFLIARVEIPEGTREGYVGLAHTRKGFLFPYDTDITKIEYVLHLCKYYQHVI